MQGVLFNTLALEAFQQRIFEPAHALAEPVAGVFEDDDPQDFESRPQG